MILSELTTGEGGAVAIGALFVTCAAAAHGVNEILRLVDRMKENPPAGDIAKGLAEWADNKFATKDEVGTKLNALEEKIDGHEKQATEFRVGLKADVKDLDTKLSSRSGGIYDALRSLGREVSHLTGQLKRSGRLPGADE